MLPPEQQQLYFQQFEQLSRGKTLLLATHQLQHLDWLDQVWLIVKGRDCCQRAQWSEIKGASAGSGQLPTGSGNEKTN